MKLLTARDERMLADFDPDDAYMRWAETLAKKNIRGETTIKWRDHRAPGYIHPSSLYKKCDAYLGYELLGMSNTSRTRGTTQWTYDIGTAVHAAFQFYQESRAVHFGYEFYAEKKFEVPEYHMAGKTDGVSKGWPIKGPLVWEFKTIKSTEFQKLRKPLDGHLLQVHAYMACLSIPVSIVMYANKDKPVTMSFKVPFDKSVWSGIRSRVQRIIKQAETDSLIKTEGYECRECRFAQHCKPTETIVSGYPNDLALPRRHR